MAVKSPTTKTTRVAEVLEVLHLADEHRVAEVQIGRGRVEADLHDQGSAEGEPGAKVVQPDDVHAALGQTGYLLVDRQAGTRQLYRGRKVKALEWLPGMDV